MFRSIGSALVLILLLYACKTNNKINIQISPEASEQIQFAASELSDYLSSIYPGYQFPVVSSESAADQVIHIGTTGQLQNVVDKPLELSMEGYTVWHDNERGFVAGHDDRGVIYGVYGLLEKLGCGFYLSHESVPESRDEFSFDSWDIHNTPVTSRRLVFNWHNFLSGCTGWDLEHWQKWSLQSAKMGYNGIMVHAYGNNPMYSFEYNGKRKPTGYLTSTRKGRDWGAQHVNDVRRLHGGDIFDQPVFGPEAALVPDDQKDQAATELMQEVFSHAEKVGMDIYFAVDVDTWSANPQELIRTLPEDARFTKQMVAKRYFNAPGGEYQLVNPDHPDGYAYYKAQVQSIMENYPEVDVITVWVRRYAAGPEWLTVWRALERMDFPEGWRTEYDALVEQNPSLKQDPHTPSTFAISKIIKAYQKAIDDLNYDVEIATGSWRLNFLPSANVIYPEDVPIIPLDQHIRFYEDSVGNELAKIGKEHPLIPIVWAHHDDHRYIGKPYTPFSDFADKLSQTYSEGFGIIHWTTRPLDLYFKSLAEQVWMRSLNQPVSSTVEDYVQKIFRSSDSVLVDYVYDWLHRAPMFGRETRDYFINPGEFVIGEEPAPPQEFIEGSKKRIGLLKQVNRDDLDGMAASMYDYYMGMEQFFIDFIINHQKLVEANEHWQAGAIEKAKDLMEETDPAKVVEQYATFIQHGGITRGEQALVITMNLQWLPDFINQKQLLGMEPIRYNFQPTFHDPLAQAPGLYTYFFDEAQNIWLGLGEVELNGGYAKYMADSINYTIQNSVVEVHDNVSLPLTTYRGDPLSAGQYELEMIFPPGSSGKLNIEVRLANGDIIHQQAVSLSGGNTVFHVTLPEEKAFLHLTASDDSIPVSALVFRR